MSNTVHKPSMSPLSTLPSPNNKVTIKTLLEAVLSRQPNEETTPHMTAQQKTHLVQRVH